MIKTFVTDNYAVSITQNGCSNADAVDVNHTHCTPRQLFFHQTTMFYLCRGHDSITLSTNFQYNSYLWSTGSTAPTTMVTDTGTYNVTVSVNTCTGTAVAPVQVSYFSQVAIILDTIQDTAGVTILHVKPAIASNYFWQSDSASPYSTTTDSVIVIASAKRERVMRIG